MIPVEALSLEEETDDDSENSQRDDFLNHLQLHKGEGASVSNEADAVGGYCKAVFNEGDAP